MKNEKEEGTGRHRRKEEIETKVLEFAGDGRKRKKWRNFLSEEKNQDEIFLEYITCKILIYFLSPEHTDL